ncbi:MAG: PIN domain-containing protein [Gemmataceae bacterium]|nr:PIN domain-containing protein [Gemmataceae bacterium]
MILTDASVLIDYDRRDPKLVRLVPTLPVTLCGPTRAEVLAGARNSADRQRLLVVLASFPPVPITDPVWDAVGDNLLRLRRAGLTIPFPDVVVATAGIAYDVEVWARDQHFPRMAAHLPALRLFAEPP